LRLFEPAGPDLGKLLPGLIYAHYIGVDSPELRDRVVQAADQLGSWNDPEYTAIKAPAEVFMNAALTLSTIALELAEQRRKQPGDDMVTWLVEVEFEGRRMDDSNVASFFASWARSRHPVGRCLSLEAGAKLLSAVIGL
jgi:cytochrome P450